jgi:hypothetical protein
MRRKYNVGTVACQIDLEVKVGTVGSAHTLVYKAFSGGQRTDLAESDMSSGNIARSSIGTNDELRGGCIVVYTTIDFGIQPDDQWPQCLKGLDIEYHFWGGFSAHQAYNYDNDDIISAGGGKIVTITKAIKME